MTATADLLPGSADWLQYITASKVAAILGVSPYDSPRSLWDLMHGDVEREPQTDEQARGHYLEPAILTWFFDHHPELVRRSPEQETIYHPVIEWAAARPDAMADVAGDPFESFPVEAKTDAGNNDWGVEGTDEIPTHYAAQCMWTMHVTGTDRIYVPMLTTRLEFREYVVDYDLALALAIEKQCLTFLESLSGDEPPAVDSHPATYESLRRANPLIDTEAEAQLSEADARLFVDAKRALSAAEARFSYAKSTVAEVMGTARKAFYGDLLVAVRQNSSNGTPYVKATKPLPEIPNRGQE